MMNPFMSYTQSFNESMTKDDREDAERRMATVRPVTAGIASKAVINAQSNMTKDDREDAERRLAYAKSVTPTVVQSGMTKDDREDAERRMATVRPVTAGIASKAVINAQSNMTKNEREALETATRQISPSAQLSSNAPVAQSPYPSASYGGPSGMTKDDREDAERRMATVKPVTAGIASKAVIQAQQSGDAIQETQDAIAAAFKAISVSKSQGTVNVNAFNNARIELKNAKDALAVAQSRATPGEQVLMSQLQEQVDTIQGEVDIQLRYLQVSASPSGGGSTTVVIPGTGTTGSPVIKTTSTGGGTPPAAAAGTDWVKLALQVGAAYLLLA